MPKVLRQVEQEVSHAELNGLLLAFAKTQIKDGVYLKNADGTQGEKVNDGDCLVPNEQTYAAGMVAPDTHVVVAKAVDEAGILWGAFVHASGQYMSQFFLPEAFVGKHYDAPVKGVVSPRKKKA